MTTRCKDVFRPVEIFQRSHLADYKATRRNLR